LSLELRAAIDMANWWKTVDVGGGVFVEIHRVDGPVMGVYIDCTI